jgi:glycosyltransferase involved in cell wall biosynthesis
MLHRPPPSWRSRHVFGAIGLRPASAQHSRAEAELLKRFAADARTVVELGVAEGGSAAELRSVMAVDGHLHLVDPYEPGQLRISMPRIVARRTVGRVRNGRVTWIRSRSDEAISGWGSPIDFLFIDADHSYERASSDWRLWTPYVVPGGHVALHDSVVFPGGWTGPDDGPVRLLSELMAEGTEWGVVAQADSLTVVRRRGTAAGRNGSVRRRVRVLRAADVPRSTTAGMSGFMLRSGAELERHGHEVTYLFRDRLAPQLTHSGLRRLLVPWLIVARVAGSILRGERTDVVEIHEPLSAPYAVISRLFGRRLPECGVLSFGLEDRGWSAQLAHLRIHGRKPSLKSRILVPLTLLSQARIGLQAAAVVLVPSSTDRDHLVQQLGLPEERVSCVFTGVDEALFELPTIDHDEPRFLFLGTWIERKGTLELTSAWRRLVADRPQARLTIAGAGDYDWVRATAGELPGVQLVPIVERQQLPALLTQHNIFVLPSFFEGMSLAMLEAAAAGLACVVTGVCGSLDVFRPPNPEEDGALLVRPSDEQRLYEALLRLVDDRELRVALGVRARARARSFTWSQTAEEALAAYLGALKRAETSPNGHQRALRL